MRRVPIFVALILGLAVRSAAADCPASKIVVYNEVLPPVYEAVYDTVMRNGGWGSDFDLTQGRVHTFQGGSMAITSAEGVDAFDVVGVAPGTPVTVTVVLTSDATISGPCSGSGCSGVVEMTLSHGAEVSTTFYQRQVRTVEPVSIHDERSLTVTIVAGTPEVISYEVLGHHAPGGGNPTDVTGHLTFRGLPEGIGVTSCYGYEVALTPTRRASWGRLKTLYR